MPSKPTVAYWHVWTDIEGVSHQRRCAISNFEMKGMGGASPQWQDELSTSTCTINISVLPVGWTGDWHENPKPQWIIPLSGRWWVETMDGERVEMGAGDISFGEDQGCRADAQGRRGHLSGTLGDAPAVLLLVQSDEAPTIDSACRFA